MKTEDRKPMTFDQWANFKQNFFDGRMPSWWWNNVQVKAQYEAYCKAHQSCGAGGA